MTLEQLQALIERLNDDGHPFRVKGIRINPDERFRYADQIEMDIDTYLEDEFQTELEVLQDIQNIFGEVDDDSWMFDDEDDQERKELY